MDALVNAIFVASSNFQKVEDRAIPANVVSIAFLPVCNECQVMISHDVLNGNSTEVNIFRQVQKSLLTWSHYNDVTVSAMTS